MDQFEMLTENVSSNVIPTETQPETTKKGADGQKVGLEKDREGERKKKGAAPPPPSSAPPPEAKTVARKKKKKKIKGMEGRGGDDLGVDKPAKKPKIGPPPGKPPGHAEDKVGKGGGVAGLVPQLNLGGLGGGAGGTPAGGAAGMKAVGQGVGLSTPNSAAPLPPPPPPSTSSSLGERRRSSVGIRLSLASIPEAAAGATAGGPAEEKKSMWTFYRDTDNQPYYLHNGTGESRWAYEKDTDWMEVEDPSTGCTYLENAKSGETKWKKAENGTVWVELKDPITQEHYYYSNAAGDSQWTAPLWLDYIEEETGCLYYFNTLTKQSTTKRSGGGGVVSAGVQYSMAKRPKTAPPTKASVGTSAESVIATMEQEGDAPASGTDANDPSSASG
ncbi:hypothetical protein TrRE_jg2272 [Triparma retinervis]|uniref:WW domain-containing protein n=1 Tax=Triparma retinervis TaxID=2557542 RepID=A0A9W7AAJ4_9STRA|nr:hypothetical protein TrRE_jg2272 [Triparma retinervis]